MGNEISSANETQTEQAGIKRKLAWRMGFAGLMIVMLLGTLAIFDRLSAPDEPESSAPSFTEPVPVPKKEMTQPVKPAEPVLDVQKAAEPEASAAPVEPPARPEVAPQPVLPRAQPLTPRPQPVGHPVATTPTASQPAPPRPVEEAAPVMHQLAVPTGGGATLGGRLFSGFALQAGVFSDLRLAEELHAKLTLNGIPSTFEARVQVGPFKTREEAEAARGKMKVLGIDAVLLMPPKGAARR